MGSTPSEAVKDIFRGAWNMTPPEALGLGSRESEIERIAEMVAHQIAEGYNRAMPAEGAMPDGRVAMREEAVPGPTAVDKSLLSVDGLSSEAPGLAPTGDGASQHGGSSEALLQTLTLSSHCNPHTNYVCR